MIVNIRQKPIKIFLGLLEVIKFWTDMFYVFDTLVKNMMILDVLSFYQIRYSSEFFALFYEKFVWIFTFVEINNELDLKRESMRKLFQKYNRFQFFTALDLVQFKWFHDIFRFETIKKQLFEFLSRLDFLIVIFFLECRAKLGTIVNLDLGSIKFSRWVVVVTLVGGTKIWVRNKQKNWLAW